jgi:hypothetical protein
MPPHCAACVSLAPPGSVRGFGDRFAAGCLRRFRRDIVTSKVNLVLVHNRLLRQQIAERGRQSAAPEPTRPA